MGIMCIMYGAILSSGKALVRIMYPCSRIRCLGERVLYAFQETLFLTDQAHSENTAPA